MYNYPVKLSFLALGATAHATGSISGSRSVSVGSYIYNGDTLTVSSASYILSSSNLINIYSLESMTSGSWRTEYNAYVGRPNTQRKDLITVTGSYNGVNRIASYLNKSKS